MTTGAQRSRKKTAKRTTKKATKKTGLRRLRPAAKPTPKKTGRKKAPGRRPATAPRTAPRPDRLEKRIRDLEAQLAQAAERETAVRQERDEARNRLEQVESQPPLPEAMELTAQPPGDLEDGMDEVLDATVDDSPEEEDLPEDSSLDSDLAYENYDDDEGFLSSMSGSAQRRRELDRERADRELELGDESFWLICPRCGEYLVEHEFDNIKVERCESCGVVALDKGEIELLLSSDLDRVIAYRIKGLLQ